MNVWQENYGADIDGNRGQLTTFAELDESDIDEVVEELIETFIDGTFDGTKEIEIDGFSFNVDISDYFDELVERAKKDMGDEYKEIEDDIEDFKLEKMIEKAEKMSRKKAGTK